MGPSARAWHDGVCTLHNMEHTHHDKSSNHGHSSRWEVERERGKKSDRRPNWRSEKRSDWRSDQKSRHTSSCKDEKMANGNDGCAVWDEEEFSRSNLVSGRAVPSAKPGALSARSELLLVLQRGCHQCKQCRWLWSLTGESDSPNSAIIRFCIFQTSSRLCSVWERGPRTRCWMIWQTTLEGKPVSGPGVNECGHPCVPYYSSGQGRWQ